MEKIEQNELSAARKQKKKEDKARDLKSREESFAKLHLDAKEVTEENSCDSNCAAPVFDSRANTHKSRLSFSTRTTKNYQSG